MPHSIQITKDSPLLHDANCIYCHVDLELGDQVVVCASCDSPHHADCWQANGGGCATFGCVHLAGVFEEPNLSLLSNFISFCTVIVSTLPQLILEAV